MMPTHGYGPIRSLLLGSVTAKVLHDAACPVWTVAHPSPLSRDPDTPFRHILCALAGETKELPLLQWAAEFAEDQNATLRLVHAMTGFEEEQAGCSEDPLREFLFGVALERIGNLQAKAGTFLDVIVDAGHTAHVVRELALQEQAELLIIGRGAIQKPLGRLRSSAYAIIRDAPCPVISI